MEELIMFITSATALADPLVALPAVVLLATVAAPLVASRLMLLVIWLLVVAFSVALADRFVVLVTGVRAACANIAASIIG